MVRNTTFSHSRFANGPSLFHFSVLQAILPFHSSLSSYPPWCRSQKMILDCNCVGVINLKCKAKVSCFTMLKDITLEPKASTTLNKIPKIFDFLSFASVHDSLCPVWGQLRVPLSSWSYLFHPLHLFLNVQNNVAKWWHDGECRLLLLWQKKYRWKWGFNWNFIQFGPHSSKDVPSTCSTRFNE